MSFTQLFAAGRSFIGMQDTRSYRIRPENRLPKFESTKNPFAPKIAAGNNGSPSLGKIESVATPSVKVAPMETYPLFDAELKPMVRNEPPPVRGSVRVVTVSQSCLPQTQAKPGRSDAVLAGLRMGTRNQEATVSGGKVGDATNRAPSLPSGTVEGLMDGSPLGLKTGKPGKSKLPTPVVSIPGKEAAGRPEHNCETVPDFGLLISDCGLVEKAAPVETKQALVEKRSEDPQRTFADAAVPATVSAPEPGKLMPLLRKLNPIAYVSGKLAERREAKARMPVQAELSLEKVKVKRNDLSDTDFEVVTIRSNAKAEKVAPRLEPMEASRFGRLASRFFGAEQAQPH